MPPVPRREGNSRCARDHANDELRRMHNWRHTADRGWCASCERPALPFECSNAPGTPDLVFPRHRAVILIHGCFWHGHDCPMFRLPATRHEFWSRKIGAAQVRDAKAHEARLALGWRILKVWECSLRGTSRMPHLLMLE